MLKKIVLVSLAVIAVAGLTSCDIFGGTGVKGVLILEPGQTGDVRNARVELYEKSDLTGDPVKYSQSESGGTDLTEAAFEITDVLAGYYYLLAWKDVDGDGEVSGGDLVGVNGGSYTPGEGGQQLTIEDGKMTDVGDISMKIFVEPVAVVVIGSVKTDAEGDVYAEYTYTFNKDVNLTSITVSVAGYNPITPASETGSRNGDQSYSFGVYYWNGEDFVVPSGTHSLVFQGSDDEDSFTLNVDVTF